MNKTFEQFKEDWRAAEKLPRDPNLKVSCLCGQHNTDRTPASDEDLLHIYTILQSVDNSGSVLTLADMGL
jgi:hypothetical protein